ncbi:MAG: MFS transporter [Micropruina sp.]
MTSQEPSTDTALVPIPRTAWLAFAVVASGEIVDMLDSMVATVAGPSILSELGGSDVLLQWLTAAYTIAMAAGLLIGGRLGDAYGRKTMFLIGMAGFVAGSVASALAPTPEFLITARVVQGGFGAMMLPQAFGVIRETFPPERAAVGYGAAGPLMALGSVLGPVLGGWLVSADFFGWGWRMIFAINIPIGITALILGAKYLPAPRRDRTIGIDTAGAILASTALVAITFTLIEGRDYGWPWWSIALLLAGAAAVAVFAVQQKHRGRIGKPTLIMPSLLSNHVFVGGVTTGLFFFAAFMGSGLILAVVLQIGLGMTPIASAVTMLPQALGVFVGFVLSQKLGVRRRTMISGIIIAATGQLILAAILAWQGASLTGWWLLPALLVMGVGFGMAMGPFFDLIISGVSQDETGSASGILTALQQVGGAVGIALVGTVFFTLANLDQATSLENFTAAAVWSFVVAAGLATIATILTRLALPAHQEEAATPEEVTS